MTRGAQPLTVEQKAVIRDHMENMLPSSICKLEGMENTTKRQVADYIRSMPERVNAEMVAWTLETWIEKNGLKAEYGAVIRFIRELKKRG